MSQSAAEDLPPERPPLTVVDPTKFRWRAIWIHPTFDPPKIGWRKRLKFWWGQDIWFGRWPVLKIQVAVLALAELLRWTT